MFDTTQQQMLYGIEAYRPKPKGIFDSTLNIIFTEGLHETQHLNVLPLALLTHTRLKEAMQGVEVLGQLPSGQRGRLVQCSHFAL